jgi:hypothetical protein
MDVGTETVNTKETSAYEDEVSGNRSKIRQSPAGKTDTSSDVKREVGAESTKEILLPPSPPY